MSKTHTMSETTEKKESSALEDVDVMRRTARQNGVLELQMEMMNCLSARIKKLAPLSPAYDEAKAIWNDLERIGKALEDKYETP